MLDQLMDHYKRREEKHTIACKQLGAYSALITYAIDTLNGKSTSSPESVAEYLKSRHVDLLKEQETVLFAGTQLT